MRWLRTDTREHRGTGLLVLSPTTCVAVGKVLTEPFHASVSLSSVWESDGTYFVRLL